MLLNRYAFSHPLHFWLPKNWFAGRMTVWFNFIPFILAQCSGREYHFYSPIINLWLLPICFYSFFQKYPSFSIAKKKKKNMRIKILRTSSSPLFVFRVLIIVSSIHCLLLFFFFFVLHIDVISHLLFYVCSLFHSLHIKILPFWRVCNNSYSNDDNRDSTANIGISPLQFWMLCFFFIVFGRVCVYGWVCVIVVYVTIIYKREVLEAEEQSHIELCECQS